MRWFPVIVLLSLVSCQKNKVASDLEVFVESSQELEERFLIACAGGTTDTFMGNSELPISIFYYNVDGASEATIYVKSESGDPTDFASYSEETLDQETLFNGRMGRFLAPASFDEKWTIVAYTTDSTYHVSDPIHIQASNLPTADISGDLVQTGDTLQPYFDWSSDPTIGNVIYFSLVFDQNDNFVSGTYTVDKWWQFYDLTNVVLNVTPTPNPMLQIGVNYSYLNMGVDEDNWVRSFGTLPF